MSADSGSPGDSVGSEPTASGNDDLINTATKTHSSTLPCSAVGADPDSVTVGAARATSAAPEAAAAATTTTTAASSAATSVKSTHSNSAFSPTASELARMLRGIYICMNNHFFS